MRKGLLPLNIQMFAEGGEEGATTETTPKTYSEEDYTKQANEIAKLKAALDKTNAENKKYKDSERARLSEEEKAKLLQEERNKEFEELKNKLRKSELSNALKSEFSEEHTSKLVSAILEGKDDTEIANVLCAIRKEIVDEVTKSVKDEIRKGTYIPNGNGSDNEDDDFGKQLAKDFGRKQNKAMEYFDNQRRR